jgi:hypothetical protein
MSHFFKRSLLISFLLPTLFSFSSQGAQFWETKCFNIKPTAHFHQMIIGRNTSPQYSDDFSRRVVFLSDNPSETVSDPIWSSANPPNAHNVNSWDRNWEYFTFQSRVLELRSLAFPFLVDVKAGDETTGTYLCTDEK